MEKWEYFVALSHVSTAEMEQKLNKYADQGWEFVASTSADVKNLYHNLIFRRKKA